MNAVLYIEIADEMVYTYDKPVLNFVQHYFPDTVVFDFDNRSEAATAGYAIEIVEKAQKIAIILQLQEGNIGPVLPFMETVISNKEKCLLFINGANRIIERMLLALDSKQLKRNLPEALQQEEISRYLSVMH